MTLTATVMIRLCVHINIVWNYYHLPSEIPIYFHVKDTAKSCCNTNWGCASNSDKQDDASEQNSKLFFTQLGTDIVHKSVDLAEPKNSKRLKR